MRLDIVTSYPIWFLTFCILLGVIFAILLYFTDRKNEFSITLKWILGVFRTIVITLIAFLLLNPLIKSKSRFVEQPIVIIAQDNSRSITTVVDSVFYKNQYPQMVQDFISDIEPGYQVDVFSFGDQLENQLRLDFSEKQTDFSNLFNEIYTRYANRNVGALIIASDGIFNTGYNPLYASADINFPIYTIALGDTTIHKDLILSKVNYNRIAYLGNEFPVEAIIKAMRCSGMNSELRVKSGDEVILSKTLNFDSDNQTQEIKFLLKAEKTGMQRYRFEVGLLNGEISYANNHTDIFVDVLEGKQKILILYNSPHPDVTALKEAIASNRNYEVKDFPVAEFTETTKPYNLVILHGLPTLRNPTKPLLEEITKEKVPVLFIITQQVSFPLLNELKFGYQLTGDPVIFNETTPVYNNNFTAFSLPDKLVQSTENYPPLISPYGNYQLQPQAISLFYQQIGSVETTEPLYFFITTADIKAGFINGEGIWKWRLKNFEMDENFTKFNDLINKTIQYLSARIDKSYFRIFGKNNFTENENIEFDAELYNASYELVNDPEISLEITNSEGAKYNYNFSPTANAYYLNAGSLPAGQYTYTSLVNFNNKTYSESGEFTVSPLNIEKINTIADHNLMFNLAANKGGKMYFPNQFKELASSLRNNDSIKPVSYTKTQFTEILNFPWLLGLILLLISAEWFLRKRNGGY
ncbi:MAG: hypothetical protein JW731_15930 [Bacteroidales bacterium]|nr:hypothetical protein [Bacteroidales bacterium]